MQAFNTKVANNGTTPDGQLTAVEFNQITDELEGAIARSGQTLSAAKLVQLARAMSITALGAHAMQDGGVANAYTLTPITGAEGLVLPEDYTTMNGAQISFVPGNANTGGSTLNIGQTVGALLGTKKLLAPNGAELRAGDLAAGVQVECRYDQSADSGTGAWLLSPEISLRGVGFDGTHDAYTGDLDAIARNSLYAIQQGVATHLPEDLPAEAWAFVHTMVLPADAGRTQVLWSADAPDRLGWWRRRLAGVWSEWRLMGADSAPIGTLLYNVLPGYEPPLYAPTSGQITLRADYPELWALAQAGAVSEVDWANGEQGCFSTGDGATTFRWPLIDAEFVRALDRGRGVDINRLHGSRQLGTAIVGDNSKSGVAAVSFYNNTDDTIATSAGLMKADLEPLSEYPNLYYAASSAATATSYGGSLVTTSRPRNIAYPAWIKYA